MFDRGLMIFAALWLGLGACGIAELRADRLDASQDAPASVIQETAIKPAGSMLRIEEPHIMSEAALEYANQPEHSNGFLLADMAFGLDAPGDAFGVYMGHMETELTYDPQQKSITRSGQIHISAYEE